MPSILITQQLNVVMISIIVYCHAGNAEDVFQKLSSSTLPLVEKTNSMLTVERVSPVDTILFEGIDLKDDKCDERFLTMYFRNKMKSGAGGKATVMVTGKGQAAVTFEDVTGQCIFSKE